MHASRFPSRARGFTLPKAGQPGALRLLTWLDPFDEITLRVLVGRLIAPLETAFDRREIFAYVPGATGPGWWTKPHSEPVAHRRALGLELLAESSCRGLCTFDVQDYYRSVQLARLRDVLSRFNCPMGAVDSVVAALQRLEDAGGPGGLPIGFEGSGVLANAFLTPLDDALRDFGPIIRYTDDVWLFANSRQASLSATAAAASTLANLGLRLNESKTWYWEKPFDRPEDVIRNQTVDSFTGSGSRRVAADEALRLLRLNAAADTPDWPSVRFAFANLASHRDARALEVLYEHPSLFVEEPVRAAQYLSALARDDSTSRAVDRDWIVMQAAVDTTPRALAKRVHACKVAVHLKLGRRGGEQLFDVASSISDHQRAPLQVWAATAWGASAHWKPQTSVDAAEHFGKLSVRRAFCLPLRNGHGSQRKRKQWARHLVAVEPDLRPSVEYVMSYGA